MEDERIIGLLEEISKDLKKVLLSMDELHKAELDDPRNWVSPQDTMKILGVSERTLYTLRENNQVIWKLLGKQHRYFVRGLYNIRNYHLK